MFQFSGKGTHSRLKPLTNEPQHTITPTIYLQVKIKFGDPMLLYCIWPILCYPIPKHERAHCELEIWFPLSPLSHIIQERYNTVLYIPISPLSYLIYSRPFPSFQASLTHIQTPQSLLQLTLFHYSSRDPIIIYRTIPQTPEPNQTKAINKRPRDVWYNARDGNRTTNPTQ